MNGGLKSRVNMRVKSRQKTFGQKGYDFFTIGYEKLKLEDLFLILKDAEVECLIDIRDMPWSMVPDYRKGQLEDAIGELSQKHGWNIEYVPMPALGNPPFIRKSDKSDEDAMAAYREYISGKKEPIEKLVSIIKNKRSALMCYEKDKRSCHRSILAAILEDRYGLSNYDLRGSIK
jgi:uncharacterized protein (DUF488 family)